MVVRDSYYVKRNGRNVWLRVGLEPETTDIVLEIRPMLVADEGKVLLRKDTQEIVGGQIWLKDTTIDDYEEIDEPPEPEPEPEPSADGEEEQSDDIG